MAVVAVFNSTLIALSRWSGTAVLEFLNNPSGLETEQE
jgi:hypothetical protein